MRILPPLAWGYANPGLLVAGAPRDRPGRVALASIGGTDRSCIANRTAPAISEGKLDVALIAGADCLGTRVAASARPRSPGPQLDDPTGRYAGAVMFDEERDPVTAVERAASLDRPVRVFPLFANALRYAAGRTIEEDAVFVSEFWSRFSEVAAGKPYAWSPISAKPRGGPIGRTREPDGGIPVPEARDGERPRGPWVPPSSCAPRSRVCAGVPDERMVFPVSGSEANDHWFLTHRMDLCSSPAIRCGFTSRIRLAGTSVGRDLSHRPLLVLSRVRFRSAAAEIGLL